MRNAKALLALLLLVIVAAAAIMYFGEVMPSRTAVKKEAVQPSVQERAEAPKTDQPEQADEPQKEALRPTFDVVRVEKDGSVVMAGQAEAGATVVVRAGKEEIGRAVANENGEWIIQEDHKLDSKEHAIELSAQSPNDGPTLYSKQRLALSLSDPIRGEPLVALTEEGKPTRILQMPTPEMLSQLAETKPDQDAGSSPSAEQLAQPTTTASSEPSTEKAESESEPGPVVGFASVDYEDADQKSMVFINGIATPGSRVAVYVDNDLAGIAVVEASGKWSYADNRELTSGTHQLRADLLDTDSNQVVARAEVSFERDPATIANAETFDTGPKTVNGKAEAEQRAETAPTVDKRPKVIIVKRGDTLWHIAEQFYGDGMHYTQIFRNNRNQIRNPHRIYPEQRFILPSDKPVLTR